MKYYINGKELIEEVELNKLNIADNRIKALRNAPQGMSTDDISMRTKKSVAGTVAVAAGSDEVTGTNTDFTKLSVGDEIKIGDETRKITAIASATSLTVDAVIADEVSAGASMNELIKNPTKAQVVQSTYPSATGFGNGNEAGWHSNGTDISFINTSFNIAGKDVLTHKDNNLAVLKIKIDNGDGTLGADIKIITDPFKGAKDEDGNIGSKDISIDLPFDPDFKYAAVLTVDGVEKFTTKHTLAGMGGLTSDIKPSITHYGRTGAAHYPTLNIEGAKGMPALKWEVFNAGAAATPANLLSSGFVEVAPGVEDYTVDAATLLAPTGKSYFGHGNGGFGQVQFRLTAVTSPDGGGTAFGKPWGARAGVATATYDDEATGDVNAPVITHVSPVALQDYIADGVKAAIAWGIAIPGPYLTETGNTLKIEDNLGNTLHTETGPSIGASGSFVSSNLTYASYAASGTGTLTITPKLYDSSGGLIATGAVSSATITKPSVGTPTLSHIGAASAQPKLKIEGASTSTVDRVGVEVRVGSDSSGNLVWKSDHDYSPASFLIDDSVNGLVYDSNGANPVAGAQEELPNGTYYVTTVGSSQQDDDSWVVTATHSQTTVVDVSSVTAADMKAYIWGQRADNLWTTFGVVGADRHDILGYRSVVNGDTAIGGKTLKEFVNASGSTTAGDLTTNGPIAVTGSNTIHYPPGINSVGVVDVPVRFTGTVTGTSVVKPYWGSQGSWTALPDITPSGNGSFSATRTVTLNQGFSGTLSVKVLSDDASGNVELKGSTNVVNAADAPANDSVNGGETTASNGQGGAENSMSTINHNSNIGYAGSYDKDANKFVINIDTEPGSSNPLTGGDLKAHFAIYHPTSGTAQWISNTTTNLTNELITSTADGSQYYFTVIWTDGNDIPYRSQNMGIQTADTFPNDITIALTGGQQPDSGTGTSGDPWLFDSGDELTDEWYTFKTNAITGFNTNFPVVANAGASENLYLTSINGSATYTAYTATPGAEVFLKIQAPSVVGQSYTGFFTAGDATGTEGVDYRKYYVKIKANEEPLDTSEPFRFTVNTTASYVTSGGTGTGTFKLPLVAPSSGGDYDCWINWGQGGNMTHLTNANFSESLITGLSGTVLDHPIEIHGKIKGWAFNNTGDRNKMAQIQKWGQLDVSVNSAVEVRSSRVNPDGSSVSTPQHTVCGAFWGCENLTIVNSDSVYNRTADQNESMPYVGESVTHMFEGCTAMNTPTRIRMKSAGVKYWSKMFWGCNQTAFALDGSSFTTDQSAEDWNVSDGEWFDGMFGECKYFGVGGTTGQPTDISKWNMGNAICTDRMFYGCEHFNSELALHSNGFHTMANLKSAWRMFMFCHVFNPSGGINGFSVHTCQNFEEMFRGCTAFNQLIDSWNTEAAKVLDAMFWDATSYNQPMSNWNTANVVSMTNMFRHADKFNQDLVTNGNAWNVSKVIDMLGMFQAASIYMDFNGSLAGWNTPVLTNMDSMFYGCEDFNQDINHFDVADVTDMDNLFGYCSSFDQDLSSWNVAAVTTASNIFHPNVSFSASNRSALNNTAWTTNSVTNAQLGNISVANDPFISVWRVGDSAYGDGSLNLKLPIHDQSHTACNFTVDWGDGSSEPVNASTHTGSGHTGHSNDVTVDHTYATAGDYTVTISGSQIYGWTTGVGGVNHDREKLIDITQWGMWNSGYTAGQFYFCSNLVCTATDSPWANGSSKVPSKLDSTFAGCAKLGGGLSGWDTSGVTSMENTFESCHAFNGDINGWDVSNVDSMNEMFKNALVFNKSLSSWNPVSCRDFTSIFEGAAQFNQELSSWNTNAGGGWGCTGDQDGVQAMFKNATNFNNGQTSGTGRTSPLNWGNFKVGSNAYSMFNGATSFNQDINWNCSSTTNMSNIFYNAAAFNGDISTWQTNNVTNMLGMFKFAKNFNCGGTPGEHVGWTLGLGKWTVASVTTFAHMFFGAEDFNNTISTWGDRNFSSSPINMNAMFYNAIKFNDPIGGNSPDSAALQPPGNAVWDVSSVTNMNHMFFGDSNITTYMSFNAYLGDWDLVSLQEAGYIFYDGKKSDDESDHFCSMSAYNLNSFLSAHRATNIMVGSGYPGSQVLSYGQEVDFVGGSEGSTGSWNKAALGSGSEGGYHDDGTGPHIGPVNHTEWAAWIYENAVTSNPGSGWTLTEL